MELDDFQVVTTRPGDSSSRAERSQGARSRRRGRLTWLPTQWLTLVGTLGFNDAKFLEFPIGGCPQTCRTPTATPIRAAI